MNDAAIKKIIGNIKTIISDPLVSHGFSGIKCDMTPFEFISKELNKRDKEFHLDKYACKQIYLLAKENYVVVNNIDNSSLVSDLSSEKKEEFAKYVLEHYLKTPLTYFVVIPLQWMKPLGVYNDQSSSVSLSQGKKMLISFTKNSYEEYAEFRIKANGYFSYTNEKIMLKTVMQSLNVLVFLFKQNGIIHSVHSYHKLPATVELLMGKDHTFLSIDANAICGEYQYFNRYLTISFSISKYLNELSLMKSFEDLPTDSAQSLVESTLLLANSLIDNKSDEAARVKSAIDWLIQSEVNEDDTMSFIQVCMGLESIFGDNDSEGGLTNSLADRCAYLIGRNIVERKEIKEEFKKMYRVRSKIIHGVKSHLTQNEEHIRSRAFYYLQKSILKEIRNLRDLPERKL
ncbi:TPA: hypothetical protein N5O03_000056 [Enterobacter hormaechei subsp. xiangfangensis]|nr:hypothetical protein [Enterobacter hormaechei]HAV1786423.1 hypothetical protein [Enterobacter hormaechei subsp. xiangfangensis]EHN8823512.1 hypothetical protein [Enterobacter hormaechei]HCM9365963.1 hypothetical protein [Enterobacter hormaechei subsp. xiangfangensis]HCM9384021.1 hypothetical protein [Enterobacter hormaechei subsp. xiangfangensis]